MNKQVDQIVEVPINEIFSDDEMNCRGKIIPHDVIELAKSIEQIGLQQAIVVQPYKLKEGYNYRIILGHRRFKAFQILQRKTIPTIIREGISEVQARILNLQENIARKALNVQQEALAIKKFKDAGYTLQEVAQMVNMSSGWVQVRYNLLELPEEIQEVAAAGFLTQEQIKDIYSLPNKEQQMEAVKGVKEAKLRGEKKAIKIKEKVKNPLVKRERKRQEIFDMQEFIQNLVGNNFGTRCLAWTAGEISDLELYRDIKRLCDEQGVTFTVPTIETRILIG